MNCSLKTVFVIGPPRSGTTLLGFLLAGGPGILSISEPHLAWRVMPDWKFQRFSQRFQRENRLTRVHAPIHANDEKFLRWIQLLAARNGFTTLAIKETFRSGAAVPMWNSAELLEQWMRRFPTVCLMRHPYDVAASTITLCKWAIGWRGRLWRVRWRDAPWFADSTAVVRWAAQNWAAYADWLGRTRAPVLRYEDIVMDARTSMERVCRTLGLEVDPAMLDHRAPRPAFGGIGDQGVLRRPPRPIDAGAIGRGGSLTAAQRDIVRAACAKNAAQHAYELA